jgi:POT family proton-dependent oligopeptide transporter
MSDTSAFTLRSFFRSFWDLRGMPRALWIVITAYVIESMAYFGILTLMTTFLSGDLRDPDLRPRDFSDAPALVQALAQASPGSAGALIRERLGSAGMDALKSAPPGELPALLATRFNTLLHGPLLHDAGAFGSLHLTPQGSNLLNVFTFPVTAQDLFGSDKLAEKLRAGGSPAAAWLAARLRPETQKLLADSKPTPEVAQALREGLAADFSVLVTGPSLRDEAPFQSLEIPAHQLANAQPGSPPEARAELNRRLLALAFPAEIADLSPPTLKQKAYLNRLLVEAVFPGEVKPGQKLGIGDGWAGIFVSNFTMAVTLFTLVFGGLLERMGVRRAMLVGLALCLAGRMLYSAAPWFDGAWVVVVVVFALLINAAGPAITTPISYAGVKQYTDERTNSMGYGMIYALMNLGIVGIGTLSAWVRPSVQAIQDGHASGSGALGWLAGVTGSGVQAVNWCCVGITAVALLFFLLGMSKQAEAAKLRPDTKEEPEAAGPRLAWHRRFAGYFTQGPFANTRFVFFIFMLLPVRTMFAHQWLTFPSYILRAYDKPVADKMEWLVNWINPGIIFIGVPLFTALTRRVNVYTMMMIGTLVSALPTFLLGLGARLDLLITYFVVFSIGEALWSARFYEYASELAPPGKVAQYMGLANIPWLLAKGTTGFYSGLMLSSFYPDATEVHRGWWPGAMWLIYGLIAMSTPIGLWLARRWVMAGLHQKASG